MKTRFFVCACLLLFTCGQAAYALSAQSTFDTDLEGWTGSQPAPEVSWAGTDGNPGGYARFFDLIPDYTFLIAPAPFLGDWSDLDGSGVLSYDHKVFSSGLYDVARPYEVRISGPGGSANWTGATPTGPTGWVPQVIPIRQDAWTLLAGTWSGLLASVDTLTIRIEPFANVEGGDPEVCGIDNVQLVPEPSSLLALFSGVAALAALRRRRA